MAYDLIPHALHQPSCREVAVQLGSGPYTHHVQSRQQHQHATLIHSMQHSAAEIGTSSAGPITPLTTWVSSHSSPRWGHSRACAIQAPAAASRTARSRKAPSACGDSDLNERNSAPSDERNKNSVDAGVADSCTSSGIDFWRQTDFYGAEFLA